MAATAEIAEAAAGLWPAAVTLVAITARARRRELARRRRLNRLIHELRRPLQALMLANRASRPHVPDMFDLAAGALRDLDREVNGEMAAPESRPVDARALVGSSVSRWRSRARRSARPLRVRWNAGQAIADVDPHRFSQALDNLIANAFEHGSGPVTVTGSVRSGRLQIAVRDAGALRPLHPTRRRDPRRGHGLVAVGAATGGGVRLVRGPRGTVAAFDIPVRVEGASPA